MRDPKRIDRILDQIREVWKKHPDLRLMQLLGNCFQGIDNYYTEDDEVESLLRSTYKAPDERN